VPIDFDGNWPEMNLRPTVAFLHGVSIVPRSLGLGLPLLRGVQQPTVRLRSSFFARLRPLQPPFFLSGVGIFNWYYPSSHPHILLELYSQGD
jgi:hypothetical protein